MVRRYVRHGASPRGAQAMVLGGKARPLIDGRPNLSPRRRPRLAPAALRHRLVLGYEAVADGVRPTDIIEDVLDAHPRPPGLHLRERTRMLLDAELRTRLERLRSASRKRRLRRQWSETATPSVRYG